MHDSSCSMLRLHRACGLVCEQMGKHAVFVRQAHVAVLCVEKNTCMQAAALGVLCVDFSYPFDASAVARLVVTSNQPGPISPGGWSCCIECWGG